MKYDTYIFDLDGTLLSTLEDLKNSCNFALSSFGLPERTLEEVRQFVGNGVELLMKRAVPNDTDDELFTKVFETFKEHYLIHNLDTTKPYDGVLEMLDEFINYNQGKYYVIIDRLDEKWVGNDIRYQLIKSLIETLRDLNRLDNIKPIATLRYDLLGRVFDVSRDSGFQEEKYQPLYLDIRWTQSQLIDLLNSRINFQFRLRYQKKTKLTYTDIFPDRVNNIPIISFLLERTMMRPRDVIELVNFCIRRATEKEAEGFITERVVIDAEREYSKNRLRSLYYEWFVDYPGLEKLITLLRQKPSSFPLRDMADAEIENLCLDYVANPPKPDVDSNDPIFCLVEGVVKGESIYEFKKVITKIFYRVGLLGIRDCPDSDIRWSDSVYSSVDISDIEQDSMLCVHKCYWSALRIQDI